MLPVWQDHCFKSALDWTHPLTVNPKPLLFLPTYRKPLLSPHELYLFHYDGSVIINHDSESNYCTTQKWIQKIQSIPCLLFAHFSHTCKNKQKNLKSTESPGLAIISSCVWKVFHVKGFFPCKRASKSDGKIAVYFLSCSGYS